MGSVFDLYKDYAKKPLPLINEGKAISTVDPWNVGICIDEDIEQNGEPLVDMRDSGVYAFNFWETATDIHPMYKRTFDGEGVFFKGQCCKSCY